MENLNEPFTRFDSRKFHVKNSRWTSGTRLKNVQREFFLRRRYSILNEVLGGSRGMIIYLFIYSAAKTGTAEVARCSLVNVPEELVQLILKGSQERKETFNYGQSGQVKNPNSCEFFNRPGPRWCCEQIRKRRDAIHGNFRVSELAGMKH